MPAVRNTKPALAWRYPMRTPARVRITSPPTPGRATAASAATETATGRSWRDAGETTAHRSETRHRALAMPSPALLTLDLAQSHRASQPRLPRRSPAGPRHRQVAGPKYPQVAGPAAIATLPMHPREPTVQGRGRLPLRPLLAAPRRCPTRKRKGRTAVASAGRPHRQPM